MTVQRMPWNCLACGGAIQEITSDNVENTSETSEQGAEYRCDACGVQELGHYRTDHGRRFYVSLPRGVTWQEVKEAGNRCCATAVTRQRDGTGLCQNCGSDLLLESARTAQGPVTIWAPVLYQYDRKPNTYWTDATARTIEHMRQAEYSVLIGRNNCGKSFLLKRMTVEWGSNVSFLGPARYQNFNLLGYYTPNRNRKSDKHNQFLNHWNQSHQNLDNSPLNLQQAIAELSDHQRESLVKIVRLLLGVDLEIRHTVAGNSMSQQYISCGGHNISYTSSGFRLITTLVTSLLDVDYDTFLIDEPELGISPEAQGTLADFLFNRQRRAEFFPHLKTLILATHSTIFLDRLRIRNNYIVEKSNDEISMRPIESQSEFNRVHFFLLGNRFETLFLPSAIIVVEGKCDHQFIDRALAVRYPNNQFSVIEAGSDDRIKDVIASARNLLTNIQRSPYHDRIFAVIDSVHQGDDLTIEGDLVSRNGTTHRKADLAALVIARVTNETAMHPAFEAFLRQVGSAIGAAAGAS